MSLVRIAAGLALTVTAALGFAGPAPAGKPVPFEGCFEGAIVLTPVPPLVLVDVEADGVATVLGRCSLAVDAIADPAAQTAVGTYSFVAANGDMIFASFTGRSEPLNDQGLAYVVEIATITGGTGRFAGASGSFVVQRLADRIAGHTVGEFKGDIVF